MSAPAAKALWEPVRTMAPMVESRSKDLRAELSSRMRGVNRALRALGRWSSTGRLYASVYIDMMYSDVGSVVVAGITIFLPRPTPARGVDTLMCSYVVSVALE